MNHEKLLIFLILLISCSTYGQQRKDAGEQYETDVSYIDSTGRLRSSWAERKIEANKLYLFFEMQYSNDTVTIQTNLAERPKIAYLTTIPQLSVADVVKVDSLSAIKWVKISINGGKDLEFKIKERWMNKWQINYYRDTLRACPLKFAPFYD